MRARRTQRVAPVAPVDVTPPRETYRPAWYRGGYTPSPHHSSIWVQTLVDQAAGGAFRLPRFQRPYVWRDEQIVRLFESLLRGYHVGTLILWDRYSLPATVQSLGGVSVACAEGRAALVIDGQQRIGAIVAAAMSGRFFLDLDRGELTTTGPGPWKMPAAIALCRAQTAELLRWYKPHAEEHGLDTEQVFDAAGAMVDAVSHCQVSAAILDARLDRVQVIESFRRLNAEGTRMTERELEEALSRAEEE